MMDRHTILNDKQRAAVRWLRQRIGKNIDQDMLCNATGLSSKDYVALRTMLKSRGCLGNLVENGMWPDTFTIDQPILEFAREMASSAFSWIQAAKIVGWIVALLAGIATIAGLFLAF